MNNVDLRDPDKTHHPMSLAALSKATPNLDTHGLFKKKKPSESEDAEPRRRLTDQYEIVFNQFFHHFFITYFFAFCIV